MSKTTDPYPWSETNNPYRQVANEQICEQSVDLLKVDLFPQEKGTVLDIILKYIKRRTFSLREEIWE